MIKMTLWEYISENLKLRNKTELDLMKLFGITRPAIEKWKVKDSIGKEKYGLLSRYFGVSIDEIYDRKFSKEYSMEQKYSLESIFNKPDYKALTNDELNRLIRAIADFDEAMFFILDYDCPDFDDEEMDYFFHYFKVKLEIDLDGLEIVDSEYEILHEESFLNSSLLGKILEILYFEYPEDEVNRFSYFYTEHEKPILFSENLLMIDKYLKVIWNYETEYLNDLLIRYYEYKDINTDFDANSKVLNLLLLRGATFKKDNGSNDYKKTLELIRYINNN